MRTIDERRQPGAGRSSGAPTGPLRLSPLPGRVPLTVPGLPRPPSNFRLRPLSSLWGSLSPGDVLSLDLSLVLGRPSAFEYVLVHELCHLVHANHSRAFWREVEARWPGWREERDYLRGDGLALKGQLARLIR